jgi:hypothetical protein
MEKMNNMFDKLEPCVLCSRQAEIMGSVGACHHLYCPCCGEYLIAIPALTFLEVNPEYQRKKGVLSGMAFESYFYQHKPLQITPDLLAKAKDISLQEKLFKLAAYFYGEAKENNMDLSQNSACCYQRDIDKQYSDLMKTLKSYGIINYILTEDDSEDYTSHFIGIEMKIEALMAFENGINNVEEFKEAFMNHDKGGPVVNIGGDVGQLNMATGKATLTAVQINHSDMQETLKFLDELEKHIPHDISKEVKEQVDESIDAIKAELQSPQPKINVIKTLITGLRGLVNTAGFAAATITILEFIDKLPK